MECAAHKYDRIKHHGHHWIEEGTEDDFKWCILNSDLPVLVVPLIGTYVVHIGSGQPNNEFLLGFRGATFMEQGVVDPHLERPLGIGLTGTCIPVPYPADHVAQDFVYMEAHVHLPPAVNRKLIEVLMARPEVVKHEPKAAALGA
jgi:hypothetical protein